MPSKNGDDSWRNLINIIYGIVSLPYNDPNGFYGYNQARRWPLNYEPTGYYGSAAGDRMRMSYWWGMTSNSAKGARLLFVGPGPFNDLPIIDTDDLMASYTTRGRGLAIRCVVRS